MTVTTNSFEPTVRSWSPTISTVASASVVSITTSTEVLPGARSTDEPSSTSSPFTWKVARVVSVLGRTTIVTV